MRRDEAVARIRERLLRFGFPRLRMLVLVLLTGASGLLASYLMLRAGLTSMPLRYLVALLIAYAVFLLLLRAFAEQGSIDSVDVPGNSCSNTSHGSTNTAGGDHIATSHGHDGSWLDGAAADEAVLPLLLVAVVLVIVCASLWVVVSAPTLFAELAIDCALSVGLYRRLRTLERRHWLDTALRHTIWPFAATALVVVAFAIAAHHYRPQAHSIGDVFARPPGNR